MQNAMCPPPSLPGALMQCTAIIFLKIFHVCKNRNFHTHCVFIILLQAYKIATHLFVIKLCTCKGLVCLVTFQWHFKNHEIWHIYSFHNGVVFSLVVHKMSKNISGYLFPFCKIHTSLPLLYKRIYWYSTNIHT